MSGGVTVVKVGGNEVEDGRWLTDLAKRLRGIERLVVVHGGGREVTALQRAFGAEPEWHDGLRVSSPETVRHASMVLTGVVNKRLVGVLLDAGIDAIGVSGEDGALVVAEPALGGMLGRTGTVVQVRAPLLEALLGLGAVPIVSPISRGVDGKPLNVNADDVAAAVAAAISAERLLFISNVPGVLVDGRVRPDYDATAADAAVEDGVVTGGMAPKLRAAARAAAAGVVDVRIGDLDVLTGIGGTRVTAAEAVAA